jgi:hypothetical protein
MNLEKLNQQELIDELYKANYNYLEATKGKSLQSLLWTPEYINAKRQIQVVIEEIERRKIT